MPLLLGTWTQMRYTHSFTYPRGRQIGARYPASFTRLVIRSLRRDMFRGDEPERQYGRQELEEPAGGELSGSW